MGVFKMDNNFIEVENKDLRKEVKRLNKLVDELMNENKAYRRVIKNWKDEKIG